MPGHHELPALPENIHWGFHDAALEPVLHVASGDTVHLTSWAAADKAALPPDLSLVQPGHMDALERCEKQGASHMLTGPVHIEGAEPGDVAVDELPVHVGQGHLARCVAVQIGDEARPARARPVPFCRQGFRPDPETRARFFVMWVPRRPPARYCLTAS